MSLFVSALAWSQNTLPILWVEAGNANRKAVLDAGPTVTLSPTTTVMAAGYYAATNLTQVDPNLAAGNIASNVMVFGVLGTLSTNGGSTNTGNGYSQSAKTGQTNSYAVGDDGYFQIGKAWPNPRFTAQANTNQILDNLTGLIWMRDADLFGVTNWLAALSICNNLDYGGKTDWRLPNRREMQSILTVGFNGPSIPNTAGTGKWTANQPFATIRSGKYWNSTTYSGDSNNAWLNNLSTGGGSQEDKSSANYFWAIRNKTVTPQKAIAPIPTNGSDQRCDSVVVSWTDGGGLPNSPSSAADGYHLYFGPAGDMTYLGYTNGTNYDLGRLELGSNYVWRIDATNEIGTATGDIWTFNTVAPPLGKATSPTPTNGAIEVDPINTVLYWTPGLYNGEPWYNMQTLSFGLAGNMTDLGWDVSSYQWGYAVYQNEWYPNGMPAGSQMEWQVFTKLYNPGTGELWATATGDVWTFTVAMGKAINPFPADTAILQPTNTIVSWKNGGGALGYEIWFGLSGEMTNCGTTTTTNYDPGALLEGSNYEWRIDSTNTVTTATGNVWSFTAIIAPSKAVNPVPENESSGQSVTTILGWKNGLATGYEVWFGLSGDMTNCGTTITTNYTPGTLLLGSNYAWRIDSTNAAGMATGDVWTFTAETMAKAGNPLPANDMGITNAFTQVSWTPGGGAEGYEIWFGLAGDMIDCGPTTNTSYECGELVEGSTYEWRIDSTNSVETKTGNVWTFYYFPVRYFSHGDGTVTDMKTGLMWLKQSNTGNMDWETAKSYCSNLVFAGYSDWRLPSMGMAVDQETGDPYELDTLGWADGIPNTTWEGMTGTPFSGLEDFSWYISRSTLDTEEILEYCDYFIEDGSTGTFGIQNGEAVWPVRGGE